MAAQAAGGGTQAVPTATATTTTAAQGAQAQGRSSQAVHCQRNRYKATFWGKILNYFDQYSIFSKRWGNNTQLIDNFEYPIFPNSRSEIQNIQDPEILSLFISEFKVPYLL